MMTSEVDVHVHQRQNPKIGPEPFLSIRVNPNVLIVRRCLSPGELFFLKKLFETHIELAGICLVLREQLLLTVKMCRSWKHILNFKREGGYFCSKS